jgi:hypothetical protein
LVLILVVALVAMLRYTLAEQGAALQVVRALRLLWPAERQADKLLALVVPP